MSKFVEECDEVVKDFMTSLKSIKCMDYKDDLEFVMYKVSEFYNDSVCYLVHTAMEHLPDASTKKDIEAELQGFFRRQHFFSSDLESKIEEFIRLERLDESIEEDLEYERRKVHL